jgi:4-hydroxy-2-oxoheptanedioate aldolase
MENRMLTMLDDGRRPIQVSVRSGSTFLANMVSKLGFDAITLDMQHGAFGIDRLYDLVMVLDGGVVPMVRMPSCDPGMIEKVLDTGVQGVICPDIGSRAQTEVLVEACRWPRHGEVMKIAQIESVEGMENLEEIAATPGLDAFFPGPYDLSKAFGGPPAMDYEDPVAAERLRRIIDVGHEAGLKVTLPTMNAAQTRLALEWGVDWLIVGPEYLWMVAGANQMLNETRALTAEHRSDGAAS